MNGTQSHTPSTVKQRVRSKSAKLPKILQGTSKQIKAQLLVLLSPLTEQLEENTPEVIKKHLASALFCILSLVISASSLPGRIFAFGTSLVCSVTGANAYFAFAGAGLSTLTLGTQSLLMFITYLMLFLIRRSLTQGRFDEKLSVRLTENACASLFLTATRLTASLSLHSLFQSFVTICASLGAGYLFCSFFTEQRRKMSPNSITISQLVICAMCVLTLGRIKLLGIGFNIIASCVITLLVAKARGLVYSSLFGLVCGLACGNVVLGASFGISGLICSAVYMTPAICSLCFFISSVGISVYLTNLTSLSTYIPEVLTGCLLFLPLCGFSDLLLGIQNQNSGKKTPLPLQKSEFDTVSTCLSSISLMLSKLSDHLKFPSLTETSDVIDDAFAKSCHACSMNGMCYAKKQCDMDSLYKKCFSTLKASPLEADKLSELLGDKCIHSADICADINKDYSHVAFSYLQQNRTKSLASQYSAMSRLFKTTEQRKNDLNYRDCHLEKAVASALSKLGVDFSEVYVFGKRKREIEVHKISADKIPCNSSDLAGYLSGKTGISLCEPSFDISDRANMIMRLSSKDILQTEYARSCNAKDGQEINGDTSSFFENEENYFYCLISDGMGNGQGAAVTSRLSCVFLEKMLSSGASKKVTLELLNNLLLSKNDETFSTVDMLEIDKLTGKACFIKAGAAPSFILRGQKLYKISSATPPAGIIQSFSAESTSFSLEKGDVIVMMSDGIIQSGDDALWLSEIVRLDTARSAAKLCAEIMEKAKVKNGMKDDMTVCITRIH